MSSPIPFKNQERQDLDVDLECWTLCPRRFPSSVPSTVMAGLNKHRSFAEEAAFVSSVKPAAKKWGIWTIHDDLQLGKGLLTSSPYQLKRSRYVADVFTTCFCCPQVAKKNCYRLKKKMLYFLVDLFMMDRSQLIYRVVLSFYCHYTCMQCLWTDGSRTEQLS